MTFLERLPEFRAPEIKVNSRGYTINGQKYARVTSTLSIINKPGLVGWTKKVVLDKARDVLFRYAGSAGPMNLSAMMLEIETAGAERETAAALGVKIHSLIQQLWEEGAAVCVPPEFYPQVASAVAFLREYEIQPVHTEFTVWNEALHVAGTIDGVGLRHGRVVIWDWKTGRSLYPETALQLAAYASLFKVTTGMEVEEAWAVRLPKQVGEPFEARQVANLERSYDTYLLTRALQAGLKHDPWAGAPREEDA